MMGQRSYARVFWALAIGGLLLDQGTKYGIFAHLYHDGRGGQIPVLNDAFQIVARFDPLADDPRRDGLAPLRVWGGEVQPAVNKGALFGIGQGNNLVFGAVSVAAALFVVVWAHRARSDRFLACALGMILAGTIGNLYDRVVFRGVRDFLHWYKWFDWPVFNVADMFLVCGAGLLVIEAFVRRPEPEPTVQPQEKSSEFVKDPIAR